MSLHARLSPSSAHRWMRCPGSVHLVESLYGDNDVHSDSPFAAEGTMAHTIAEILASKHFGLIDHHEYEARFKAWQDSTPSDFWEDMLRHANSYVDLLELSVSHMDGAQVLLEQKVDPAVTAVWGTLDAAVINRDHAQFVDYKYGLGVRVDADANEQLMFYALGALELLSDVFDPITVQLTIHQPRLDHVSHYHTTAKELRGWRDAVARPAAALALSGDGHFAPSEKACRFCPAAGDCRARMEYMTKRDFGHPDSLTPAELGQALALLPDMSAWAKAIEKRALQITDSGTVIPGWKRVRSGGRRTILDEDKAIRVLSRNGYVKAQTTRTTLRPLGELEKMVGKAKLPVLLGPLLAKSEGREALVPEDDPRPEIDANQDAQQEFA